jgi:beta-lactamase regulating signal transducer with metallopeptidase domain
MTAMQAQMLAQAFCERMLDGAVAGVVLACLVWAVLRLRGRHDSRTRFAVWLLALAALVVLPFFAGPRLGGSVVPSIAGAVLHREIILSSFWAPLLLAGWAAMAALLLLRLGVGLWRVGRIHRNCSAIEYDCLNPDAAAVLRDFEASHRARLCVSRELATPAALGFLRPSIAFPEWLLPQLSAAEVEIILLHEFAHLRRRDPWTNLAQKIVKAVFFFHPAVWWIESRLTLEREMACDDLVVAQSKNPTAYASMLISFAEKLQVVRGLALTQALVSRVRQMSLRVAQILDASRPRASALWKPVLVAGIGLIVFVVGAAPNVPQLLAFQPRRSHSELRQSTAQQQQVKQIARAAGQAEFATESHRARTAAQPARIGAAEFGHAKAAPVAQSFAPARQTKAIPAAYHLPVTQPSETQPALQPAAAPRSPAAPVRVIAARQQPSSGETVFIVQATEFDPASGRWTLCIWTVKSVAGEKLLEEEIVSSSI